jgi:uncharacterized membrane protein
VSDHDRNRAEEAEAKVLAACYSLGELQSLLGHPEYRNREQDLAHIAADLRTALQGSTGERAALLARRQRDAERWTAESQRRLGGEPRG